jgi:hypothetical protein
MGRRLLPSGRCVIPSGRCPPQDKSCTVSSTVRTSFFMVWTIKLQIWKLRAPVQPSGHQPSGSGRSKPYYGNYVQPKCNRPDARATPFGRGLVMEAFRATLERRLQLTVMTLGQAVRTPSGILDITFYSNIRLERNQRHWKANKIFCKLSVRTAIILVRTETFCVRNALRKIAELLFGQGNCCPSEWPLSRSDAHATKSVFDSILGFRSL